MPSKGRVYSRRNCWGYLVMVVGSPALNLRGNTFDSGGCRRDGKTKLVGPGASQVQASTVSRISYCCRVLPWHFARDQGIGQTTPFVQPCVAALLAFPMSGIGPVSKSIRDLSTENIPCAGPFHMGTRLYFISTTCASCEVKRQARMDDGMSPQKPPHKMLRCTHTTREPCA